MSARNLPRILIFLSALLFRQIGPGPILLGAGARLYKSGPIQITADGRWVWVANQDNDSVSRIDTNSEAVTEFLLPAGSSHSPRGLSVAEDGSEVWVACHDSDRLFVLKGDDGSVLAQVDLPWGSGPYSVALSRDQRHALVTLHRASALAAIDVPSRSVTRILAPVFWSPLGVAWMENGVSAWVTHLFADGEDPFITLVDVSGAEPKVVSQTIVKSTNPKQSSKLAAPTNVAEGGYLTFRGHLAQVPSASSRRELWLPTQYNNINEDSFSPDSTVQTTIRHLNLATRSIPNTNSDKVVLTALYVHDPQTAGNPYVGPGWDAHVSGPVDIAFSADGSMAYVLGEQSNNVVAFPTSTPAVRPAGAPPLPEINVGDRPMGMALSPVSDVAFVYNSLSRNVSVLDLAGLRELRRVPVTPATGEKFPPSVLQGAKIFHSSADPRISRNKKVACASCHPHAEHDGRVWDFQHLPGKHGPRSSMSLLGLSQTLGLVDPATGFGQLHRSGDRDEIQDFEHNFQGPMMLGTGFLGAGVQPELGPPNAGLSAELDALSDYLLFLQPLKRSPYRAPDGSLSEAAVRGATFFVGKNRHAKPADAGCAACHVPETGFVDFKFHDVGERRPSSEEELNTRSPAWSVNTPTLVGVWTSPPYDGVSGYASTILGVLKDQAARASSSTPHGTPDGLTGRQMADLAEFVLSIDGNMTAAEVAQARDTSPPRIVRVEPASLSTIDVWFNETVGPAAADPARWRVVKVGQGDIPVTAAIWDAQNGDRVTLKAFLEGGCAPIEYRVLPAGAILDAADKATGGAAHPLDLADPSNLRSFQLGTTLTVTLGASGYENITVPVHDAGMVGPSLSTWGHDAPWLFPTSGGSVMNTGFVRFEWEARFSSITGVASSLDILQAGFSLLPEFGNAQTIEIRRCLQPWKDPSSGGDWNSDPAGGPTWRDHAHPSARWNQAGAQALGGTGGNVLDYNGAFDLSAKVDASVSMAAINERVAFAGDLVTGAFRFWLDHAQVDYGYGLRLAAGSKNETKFERGEGELKERGPVLTITYKLAGTGPCEQQLFHRGDPDSSGRIEVTDAIFLFNYLFLGGNAPSCLESADAQNDGNIDVSDGVYLLLYLFAGRAAPGAPGPQTQPCGPDPDPPGSPGHLECAAYDGCQDN
jgi:DNA-binding beta-propeller fold protein YncE